MQLFLFFAPSSLLYSVYNLDNTPERPLLQSKSPGVNDAGNNENKKGKRI